eukprot:241976-Chlamydomonas_euryale.AAC.6
MYGLFTPCARRAGGEAIRSRQSAGSSTWVRASMGAHPVGLTAILLEPVEQLAEEPLHNSVVEWEHQGASAANVDDSRARACLHSAKAGVHPCPSRQGAWGAPLGQQRVEQSVATEESSNCNLT